MTRLYRTKWFMPLFSVALGVVVLVAMWIGGSLRGGLESLAVLAGFGLVILIGGRSETVRGLRGDGRDERFAMIDLRATALAGSVLIAAIIVAWLVAVARGESGAPYYWLGAIAGIAYLFGVAVLRLRG